MKYLLPLLSILIIIFLIFLITGGFNGGTGAKAVSSSQTPKPTASSPSASPNNSGTKENTTIDTNQQGVEVLPQIIRPNTNEDAEELDTTTNPFNSIMNLVGIIYSKSHSSAIIEWGSYSYIVQINDKVGDSEWTVSKIDKNNITLQSKDNSIVLKLAAGTNN